VPSILVILLLAVVQGACELLPVSSSAHVIVLERLLGLDPTTPQLTLLLVMLHTGTMLAVIAYFWRAWRSRYLSSRAALGRAARNVIVASLATAVVGGALIWLIERFVLGGSGHAEVESLFGNLRLIAISLFAVGVLIIWSGRRATLARANANVDAPAAAWIGAVQGLCLPFRGFSRSGATISTALLSGVERVRAEEFSFALAVVLTPPVIARELLRLWRARSLLETGGFAHSTALGLLGMGFSFVAGLLALRLLSRLLEGGQWRWFGYYCLCASAAVLALSVLGH
jgi:undecaprenyl-diphosphatase